MLHTSERIKHHRTSAMHSTRCLQYIMAHPLMEQGSHMLCTAGGPSAMVRMGRRPPRAAPDSLEQHMAMQHCCTHQLH